MSYDYSVKKEMAIGEEEDDDDIDSFAGSYRKLLALSSTCPGCGGKVNQHGHAVLAPVEACDKVAGVDDRSGGLSIQEAAAQERSSAWSAERQAEDARAAAAITKGGLDFLLAFGTMLGVVALAWAWYDILFS